MVLGVRWDVLGDQVAFDVEGVVETDLKLDPMKGNVISLNDTTYGFLSPVTMMLNMPMQELCCSKLVWEYC